jgi:hypothetical protein
MVSFRVTPNPRSLGCASGRIVELPRLSRPPATPLLRLRVTPDPASTAGSMMTPRLVSNFASSAYTVDESSFPIGSCTFLPSSGCILNFHPTFHFRTSRSCPVAFNQFLHRPAKSELRFQFPARSPTEKESRTDQSVEASAKSRIICGFHQSWCRIQCSQVQLDQFLRKSVDSSILRAKKVPQKNIRRLPFNGNRRMSLTQFV